jgi:glycosyltransferase involved in cell wall biosynthesis
MLPDMRESLTIVLCAYNAEATISRTLSSLSPYIDCGIRTIIVDDGSNDRTSQIVYDFVKSKNKVSLIQQSRGGSASARNSGLRLVQTEYVMFCDADDEILPVSFFEIDEIMHKEPDLIYFDYQVRVFEETHVVRTEAFAGGEGDSEIKSETLNKLVEDMGFWRILYKVAFLRRNQIRFYGELQEISADFFVLDDYFFLLKALSCAVNVHKCDGEIYRYYRSPSPKIESYRLQSRFMARAAYKQISEIRKFNSEIRTNWYQKQLARQLLSSYKILSFKDNIRYFISFARTMIALKNLNRRNLPIRSEIILSLFMVTTRNFLRSISLRGIREK